MLVRIITNYGTQKIIDICDTSVSPEKADIVISTAHKAKGLEWDRVRIGADFKAPDTPNDEGKYDLPAGEWRLLYVSVTRAKKHLDATAISWIDDLDKLNEV
jgi:superfamily I DNA/RNA helicase